MESNQANNQIPSNEDAVAELLTLTCEIDQYGTKIYRNKEGHFDRIHGPALIFRDGTRFWYKNDKLYKKDKSLIE